MTTETTNDSTVIDINLEEDPELSYFTWKVQVEDVASNAATTVEPTGLLTLIVTDQAWAAYPPNQRVSPGGTASIAPRPAIPTHVPIIWELFCTSNVHWRCIKKNATEMQLECTLNAPSTHI